MKIGFIGLGMMGLPMLENLASHTAFQVQAYDVTDAPFETLADHAQWGTTLTRARALEDFAEAEVLITMLPNSKITNAVIAGTEDHQGLATILSPGAVVIDMGSSDPAETMKLARLLSDKGLELIDAPVSGGTVGARAGKLTIMVGATVEALAKVNPVLEHMSAKIIPTGDVGSAHAMKTLNNYVYAAGLLAASEAVLIARRLGIDLQKFTDVLNASSGKNFATETKLAPFLVPEKFDGGFALGLQAKDLATAAGLQKVTGIAAPQLELCKDLWAEAGSVLAPGADNTEIYRFLQQRSR